MIFLDFEAPPMAPFVPMALYNCVSGLVTKKYHIYRGHFKREWLSITVYGGTSYLVSLVLLLHIMEICLFTVFVLIVLGGLLTYVNY